MKKLCLIFVLLAGSFHSFGFGDPMYQWTAFTSGYTFMNDKADMNMNLGSDAVNAMIQDRNGNTWIAVTGKGLKMFDGKKLSEPKVPKESYIRSGDVLCLAIDSKNTLWAGTTDGLVKYDGATWVNIDQANTGLKAITGIAVTATDKIYVAGAVATGAKMDELKGGGLSFFNGQGWTSYTKENSAIPDDSLENLLIDNNGHLWAIPGKQDGGLAKFDGKNWKLFNSSNSTLPANNVRAIATNSSGKVYAATTKGIGIFDGTDWKFQAFSNGFDSKKLGQYAAAGSIEVTALTVEDNGAMWVGTQNDGVFCIRDNTFKAYNQENSPLTRNSVMKIMIDKDHRKWFLTGMRNNMWGAYALKSRSSATFTTNGGGIIVLSESEKVYDPKWRFTDNTNTDLTLGSTVSIGEDKEGTLWMPNDADGLIQYKDGKRTIYRNGGEFGSAFNKMFIAPDGKIYLNTNVSGIKLFDKGTFSDYAKWPNMGGVLDMAYDKDGVLWAAGTGGLSKRVNSDWETFNKKNGDLPSIIIYAVFKDSKGMLWVGTAKGLVKYDGAAWQVITKKEVEFPSDDITFITEDNNGKMWLGTKGGISIFDGTGWTHIAKIESPKVSKPTVNAISVDKNGVAWIATDNDGLLRYDGKSWTQYDKKNTRNMYDKVTAVKAASDGKVYFASEYYQFNDTEFSLPNQSPSDVIEKEMRRKIKLAEPKKIVVAMEP